MKRRVLSLTMAFLLAFTMLPTQAAAEELPEYEEVVEENVPEEEALETESLEAEEPAAETENTEGTVLTEETEETVTEAEPVEEVTEAAAAEKTEEPEVKEKVPAEKEEASEAPAEKETTLAEQNASAQSMEENGVAVQAEEGETQESVNVVKVGETEYASLKDAFEQAESGSILTLLKDVNDGNTVCKIENKTFTLDTKTYAVNVFRIDVNSGGTLTLNGSGEISEVWVKN